MSNRSPLPVDIDAVRADGALVDMIRGTGGAPGHADGPPARILAAWRARPPAGSDLRPLPPHGAE